MGGDTRLQHQGRNPAIELYRILLMFLIVLHHSAYHGYWNHAKGLDSAYPSLHILFTALTIWHVDGFLSITGWFGTRFTIGRFAKLWGLMATYSVFSVLYGVLANGKLSSGYLVGGWFASTYLYFMFITPVLNAALELLAQDKRKLYLAWIVLNCGVVLNWVPFQLFSFVAGSGAGSHTMMTFIVVYLNVRMLKMSGLYERVSLKTVMGMMSVFVAFLAFLPLFGVCLKTLVRGSSMCWHDYIGLIGWYGYYNAPHVIIMAIAGLLLFAKFVKVPSWMVGTIGKISPLMFGVYIIHDTTTFGRLIYRLPQEWMANNLSWHPLVVVFVTAVLCFVVCCSIEGIRRIVSGPFVRWVAPHIQSLDRRLGLSA